MYLDRTNIEGTLTVRSLQIGDRFTPLGMTGTKLVSDYFTDRKVPRFLRSAPIVWDEAGIVCIMGFTVDERVKVCEQSQQLIQIRYKEDETHVG
ncbi:MAG: tRNA lysidine(34) synthetase TilS [Clostridia bacterium]|nr:tRNA lysidine(34) synthetase TilS [Clostridia bacterium]